MSMPPAARAIDQDADVELAVDLQSLFDQHPPDLLALGTGLMRDESHADHLRRQLLGFFSRLGDLDPPALAAAARMNLRLDDTESAAELFGDLTGFGRSGGHFPARHRNAKARED